MTTKPSAAKIDRRRSRTRAALMQAGQSLFAERSVEGVTIDDIVIAAEVAKGSFYNHFADKEGLAREIAAQVRGFAEAAVTTANAGVEDPAARVARALCVFVLDAVDHPERNRAQRRIFTGATLIDAPMNRGVRRDVEAGLAVGRFAGVSAESAVLMVMGVVTIAVARALEPLALSSAEAAARELGFGLLRGLGVESGEDERVATAACEAVFGGETG
jgi:AcrR family transcriptional regulator